MPSEERIRVLIAYNFEDNRTLIARLISYDEQLQVVGFASSSQETIERASQLLPDVILLEANILDKGSIETTREICSQHSSIGVIIMALALSYEELRLAMMAGAVDVLLGPAIYAQELYDTIRRAYERFGKNK